MSALTREALCVVRKATFNNGGAIEQDGIVSGWTVAVGDCGYVAAHVPSEVFTQTLVPNAVAVVTMALSPPHPPSSTRVSLAALRAFCGDGVPAPCEACGHSGKVQCNWCTSGKVTVECDECDDRHTHKCSSCDGNGRALCSKCGDDHPRPAAICGVIVDRRRLHQALAVLPGESAFVYLAQLPSQKGVHLFTLQCEDPVWVLGLVEMQRAQESYPVFGVPS